MSDWPETEYGPWDHGWNLVKRTLRRIELEREFPGYTIDQIVAGLRRPVLENPPRLEP
jgi:hypothetical protein